jgi:hypothetical protein
MVSLRRKYIGTAPSRRLGESRLLNKRSPLSVDATRTARNGATRIMTETKSRLDTFGRLMMQWRIPIINNKKYHACPQWRNARKHSGAIPKHRIIPEDQAVVFAVNS